MDARTILLIFHVFGVALGVGGATISDITFLRAVKDRKITSYEYDSLKVLSRVVWAGIAILFISGHGFLLNQYIQLDSLPIFKSGRFLAKYVLVWVVLLNGLVFHFRVFPVFARALNKDLSRLKNSKIWLIAVSGAISATTWYSIVVISLLPRGWTFPHWYYLGAYGCALVFGVVSARFIVGKILRTGK